MKEQLLGACISLMVHGMAAIIIFGISQGIPPSVKTVALDFSIDSGGPIGEDGSGGETGGGSGGDEAPPRKEASLPEDSPGDKGIETPINPTHPLLSEVAEPDALVPEKPRPVLEELSPVVEEPPPVYEKPPPVPKEPSHVVKETIPVERKPSPVLAEPKPVPREKPAEPIPVKPVKQVRPVKKAKPDPPPTFPPARSMAGADRFAGSKANSESGPIEGPSEHSGPGSKSGPTGKDSGTRGTPRGDGGNAYLKAHFNFIRGHLLEHLCYPKIARKRGWAGKVMVSFTIHPDGRADDIEVQKSCGISLLDKSALKTVQNACPFPKPPMAARIVIPILYQLN